MQANGLGYSFNAWWTSCFKDKKIQQILPIMVHMRT
nr:MAG TPA: hypothetical protein [Caudoviricetes sp.]